MHARIHTVFSIISSLIVLSAIVWGVVLVGSPATTRLSRFDRQRLGDLRTIVREIDSFCRSPNVPGKLKRPLPKTLEELAANARHRRINLTDPGTGEKYEYKIKSDTTYVLCATFSLRRDSDARVFWNHAAGKQCFTIDALDPP